MISLLLNNIVLLTAPDYSMFKIIKPFYALLRVNVSKSQVLRMKELGLEKEGSDRLGENAL